MSNPKYSEELTASQIKELENLMKELTNTAKDVVDDFETNPSELNSGSAVQIHSESPYLDADSTDEPVFKDNKWKRILKQGLPIPPKNSEKSDKKPKKSSKKSKKGKK